VRKRRRSSFEGKKRGNTPEKRGKKRGGSVRRSLGPAKAGGKKHVHNLVVAHLKRGKNRSPSNQKGGYRERSGRSAREKKKTNEPQQGKGNVHSLEVRSTVAPRKAAGYREKSRSPHAVRRGERDVLHPAKGEGEKRRVHLEHVRHLTGKKERLPIPNEGKSRKERRSSGSEGKKRKRRSLIV